MQQGYIAILSVIIVCIAAVNQFGNQCFGFFGGKEALDNEFKQSSFYLAQSCLQEARNKFLEDPHYLGNEIIGINQASCQIEPVVFEAAVVVVTATATAPSSGPNSVTPGFRPASAAGIFL